MQFSPNYAKHKSKIPVQAKSCGLWFRVVRKWYTSDRWDTGSVDTSTLI
jgi:hypothetical protein